MKPYIWSYTGSGAGYVEVARQAGDEPNWHHDNALFDVALYDPEVLDEKTGVDCREQSLRDLREMIGYANAALKAGLDPEPVPDKQ
jgi:hypothetical protein